MVTLSTLHLIFQRPTKRQKVIYYQLSRILITLKMKFSIFRGCIITGESDVGKIFSGNLIAAAQSTRITVYHLLITHVELRRWFYVTLRLVSTNSCLRNAL